MKKNLLIITLLVAVPAAIFTIAEASLGVSITDLELTFKNGKYYRVVPVKSAPLDYRVKINARGKGMLKGRWLLDEKPLGLFQVWIGGRQTKILQGDRLPRLPVNREGMHTLSLEFTNGSLRKAPPIIRYFVTTASAIEIIYPKSGQKIATAPTVELQWDPAKSGVEFEIAVSAIPFQFLQHRPVTWVKTGNQNKYLLDLAPFKKGSWVYWQVRRLDASGTVTTTSEIASFKLR